MACNLLLNWIMRVHWPTLRSWAASVDPPWLIPRMRWAMRVLWTKPLELHCWVSKAREGAGQTRPAGPCLLVGLVPLKYITHKGFDSRPHVHFEPWCPLRIRLLQAMPSGALRRGAWA